MKRAEIFNILVAENHSGYIAVLKNACRDLAECHWATSGKDAVEAAFRFHPGLIVIGRDPGGMTPCELAESLRKSPGSHVPMLILGHGFDDGLFEFQGHEKGPVDYCNPLTHSGLLAAKIRFFRDIFLNDAVGLIEDTIQKDTVAIFNRETCLRRRAVAALSRVVRKYRDVFHSNRDMETRLQQAQKMEAVGTLAGGIAHDFNNILAAIMGYVELAQFDTPDHSPSRYSLDQILKASHRARKLVSQILAFSRQTEARKKSVYLQDVILECVELLRATIPSTVSIRHVVCEGRKPVEADATQIHQVVMNLCTNAYHAMKEEGGKIFMTLDHIVISDDSCRIPSELKPGDYMKFSVSDTGCGMDKEVLEKIFDPYFTTKGPGMGTGMGLSVVHGIVKSHGGAIDVKSEPGKGSRFTVYIPVAKARDEDVVKDVPDLIPKGRERVLFVDDEKPLVDIGTKILEHLGYHVVGTSSSPEACEIFRAGHGNFDIVITDMTMPDMTGLQLAREVKSIEPLTPVILCTGYHKDIDSIRIEESGVDHVMQKPLKMFDLAMVIRTLVYPRVDIPWVSHG